NKAAGGVLTAKQVPHRPGARPARGGNVASWYGTIPTGEREGKCVMSTGLRLSLVLGLFAALAGSGLFVCSGGLALLGRECGELPDLLGQLKEECRRGAELDRQWERTLRRITVKNQVTADLIDGRLSLVQA